MLAIQNGAGSTSITGISQSTNNMTATGKLECPGSCTPGANNTAVTTSAATGAGNTVNSLNATFTGTGGQALGGVSSAQAGYASAANTYKDTMGADVSTNVSIGNASGLGNATTSPSTFFSASSAAFGEKGAGVTANFSSGDITSSTNAKLSSSVGLFKDSAGAPGVQGTVNVFSNDVKNSGTGVGGYGSSYGQSGINAGYTGSITNTSNTGNGF